MKKIVAYTCITGGYDSLQSPACVDPAFEYIVFSPRKIDCHPWQWRPLQNVEANDTLTARWHKLNPHLLFPESDYSLWLDGNLALRDGAVYEIVKAKITDGIKYAAIPHPAGGDAYDEALRILHTDKESLGRLARVSSFLKRSGFPRGESLFETNVLLRRHNDPAVLESDALWWKMLSEFTVRDQMTHSYCLYKTAVRPVSLLPEGFSTRNFPSFGYIQHDKGKKWEKDLSAGGRLRDALRRAKEAVLKIHLKLLF